MWAVSRPSSKSPAYSSFEGLRYAALQRRVNRDIPAGAAGLKARYTVKRKWKML